MPDDTKAEVEEHIDETGAVYYVDRFERQLAVSDFDYGDHYKMSCEACDKYGKNLACPPFSPSFLSYIDNAPVAKVICLRVPQEYFNHLPSEERYHACFRKARSLLVGILLDYRKKGYAVAGSGACLSCEICTVEDEADCRQCRQPDKLIYSLESMGVNVIALVKKSFDIDLEWNSDEQFADFVDAVGAVFLNDDEMIA